MRWPLITRWWAGAALLGLTPLLGCGLSGCGAPAGTSARRWLDSASWLESGQAHETRAESQASGVGAVRGRDRDGESDRFEAVHLVFDVLSIDLPSGTVHPSLNVWNHADSLRLGEQVVTRLAKNGVRAGVGSPDAWPAVEAIVDAAGGVVRRERFSLDVESPLSIARGTIASAESFFFYGSDNRLVGKTFARGMKTLCVENIALREIGGRVSFDIGFEIRYEPGGLSWVQTRDGIQAVSAMDRHVFDATRATVVLSPGEFLIVGPSLASDNDYLIGGRYFLAEVQGTATETLVCIAPRVIRTEMGP